MWVKPGFLAVYGIINSQVYYALQKMTINDMLIADQYEVKQEEKSDENIFNYEEDIGKVTSVRKWSDVVR